MRMESDVTDLEAGGVWPIGDVMETPVVSGNLWGGECGRGLMPVKLAGNFSPFPSVFYKRPALALFSLTRV